MAKVFSNIPGRRFQVGAFGEATGETPAIVPDEVGRELAGQLERGSERKRFRVEFEGGRAVRIAEQPPESAGAEDKKKPQAAPKGEKE